MEGCFTHVSGSEIGGFRISAALAEGECVPTKEKAACPGLGRRLVLRRCTDGQPERVRAL